MAREVRPFQVTIPAGTPITAPVTLDVSFPTRVVVRVEWEVPPGPNGLMGFQVANAGVPIIPADKNRWIVASNASHGWDLHGAITSGSWQIIGYNTGQYDHSIMIYFLLDLPSDQAASAVPDLTPVELISAPDGAVIA